MRVGGQPLKSALVSTGKLRRARLVSFGFRARTKTTTCNRPGKLVVRITPEQILELLPLVCDWAEDQEDNIVKNGNRLSKSELLDAQQIGVIRPDRVRLLRVKNIPLPGHPVLRATIETTKLISPLTIGLTVRYGILIRTDYWRQRRLVVHELAHTMQYERLGGIYPFLKQYLREGISNHASNGSLEQEAKSVEHRVLG